MPPIEVWAQNNLGLTSPRCTITYKNTTWPDSTGCNCTLYSYTWLQCTDPALSGHGWPRGSFPANFQFFPSPTTATSPTRTRHDVANIHNQSSTSPTIGSLSKQHEVSPSVNQEKVSGRKSPIWLATSFLCTISTVNTAVKPAYIMTLTMSTE